jgi:hypothetical protein
MDSISTVPVGQQPRPLATLATEINDHHHAAETALRSGLEHALAAGRLLLEAKGQCQHGTWGQWLTDNFEGSARTARCYMQVVERWPEIQTKRQRAAVLSFRDAVKMLAAPKELDAEQYEQYEQQLAELQTRLHGLDAIADLSGRVRACKEIIDEAAAIEASIREDIETATSDPWQISYLQFPRLSPKYIFRASISSIAYVEIHPSLKHPGYYRVAYYHDLGTDQAEVEYDVRPVKYTKAVLKRRLREAGCRRVMPCWITEEHDGSEWPACCEPIAEATPA